MACQRTHFILWKRNSSGVEPCNKLHVLHNEHNNTYDTHRIHWHSILSCGNMHVNWGAQFAENDGEPNESQVRLPDGTTSTSMVQEKNLKTSSEAQTKDCCFIPKLASSTDDGRGKHNNNMFQWETRLKGSHTCIVCLTVELGKALLGIKGLFRRFLFLLGYTVYKTSPRVDSCMIGTFTKSVPYQYVCHTSNRRSLLRVRCFGKSFWFLLSLLPVYLRENSVLRRTVNSFADISLFSWDIHHQSSDGTQAADSFYSVLKPKFKTSGGISFGPFIARMFDVIV